MKVYVARWASPWDGSHGTLGVYSDHMRAEIELDRWAPGLDHDVEAFVLDAPALLIDGSRTVVPV